MEKIDEILLSLKVGLVNVHEARRQILSLLAENTEGVSDAEQESCDLPSCSATPCERAEHEKSEHPTSERSASNLDSERFLEWIREKHLLFYAVCKAKYDLELKESKES